ncbi:MAG: DNA gyrase inhibitor YacG [Planctomycetota bacterium]
MSACRCSICGKVFESDATVTMPFCSPRCREIDLGRWLQEGYGLPYESEVEREAPEEEPGS